MATRHLHVILLSLCAAAAIVLAAGATHPQPRAYKSKENRADGVPKEWGRLVQATTLGDGSTILFFEASDGTLRGVGAKFIGGDIQYGTHVAVIPRP